MVEQGGTNEREEGRGVAEGSELVGKQIRGWGTWAGTHTHTHTHTSLDRSTKCRRHL